MDYLICAQNLITVLPALPVSLQNLDCRYNQFTSIPELPDSLYMLNCSNNPQLSCLPQLKQIVYFNFDNTAITCLPDTSQITNSTPPLSSVPLCTPGTCYPLGIHDLNNASLKVYPNPVSDKLYIDNPMQGVVFIVSDMTGRICSVPMTNDEIDVSALPSGVYLLRIQDSGGSAIKKFVKE
jgi:hypothetical protein